MNRIDPELFNACFSSWVAECWPDKPALVAIDGKTSRRSHDRKTGQKALHLVSAFATRSRLVHRNRRRQDHALCKCGRPRCRRVITRRA
jgi:hypothetical protein